MTCIVGLIDQKNNRIYIGADSAATNSSGQLSIRSDQKLFQHGDMLFGCTSSYRMIQLLHYNLVLPEYSPGKDDLFRYMAVNVVNAVRDCLKEGGYATQKNERERGGSFLVGFQGRLFHVCSDYQVEETVDRYNAIGSGDDLALGALYATHQTSMLPEERIRLALQATAHHNANVRAPFLIASVGAEGSALLV